MTLTTTPPVDREEALADPGFGRFFTDHMAVARWERGTGWGDVSVERFAPLSVSPAAMTFHYGQAIFEGLKAHRQPDKGVALFRPGDNARRFNRSAERLAMPPLPEAAFLEACIRVIEADRDWVPDRPGHSLYLRPMMIAVEPALGVRPANEYLFLVIASPAASYFTGGPQPISVWIAEDCTRAAPGGTGAAKCAGNYAAGLIGKREAEQHGCDEVVWLDAAEHRFVEEMGGMNLLVVRDEADGPMLVTPPLTDTILDGVTRSSLLQLAPELGYRVAEEPIAVDAWKHEAEAGTITEAFACGTAAVIAPIGRARRASGEWTIGDGETGAVTRGLREALVAIQEGRAEDRFGWRHPVT